MFFSSNQYPSLAHIPVAERKQMVAIAAKSENPWIGRRFSLVLLVLLIGAASVGLALPNISTTQLVLFAAVAGAAFYLYMLIEINGPIYKAVQAHVSRLQRSEEAKEG